MSIIDLDGILDSVDYTWNSLKKVVEEISKKWQELADSEALDPDADNSNFQFTLPQQYYATHYTSFTARSCTDAWNSYYNGYQAAGFCFELSLNDNVLNISNLTCLGKLVTAGGGQPEKWNYLNDTQKEQCLNDIKNYYEGQTIHIVNNYPDLPVIHSYSSYGTFIFKPTGKNNSDIYYKFNQYSGEVTSNKIQTQLANAAPYLDDSDDLIHGFSDGNLTQGIGNYYKGQPFEAVMDNLSNARNWVTTNGATNNYESSYLVYGGTMTVLYGDNYIIYVVPSGVKVNYNMMQEITKEVVTVINTDNPDKPPIDVPSYNDNKYGPQPPEPTEDDNIELLTTGFTNNIGGMGGYFSMSLNELSQLFVDFNTNAPEGTTFSQNVLSCYVNGLDYNWQTSSQTIQIHSAGARKTPFTSASNYDLIYNFNPTINAGTIDVPRCTETFYDFSPYTTYELYIPFCGWIALPDTVAGRTINVEIQCDVATMTCTGFVKFVAESGDSTLCGQITGSFGAPCPIQVVEGGLYRQAHINAGLQAYTGAIQAVAGGFAHNNMAVATGAAQAISGLNSMAVASNTNYGQTIGRAGDTSAMAGGHNCYLKITHPVIDSVVEEELFGHTVGYLCNEIGTLSDFHGFTVCLNPHINIECTGDERDEIKRLLEQGVILP